MRLRPRTGLAALVLVACAAACSSSDEGVLGAARDHSDEATTPTVESTTTTTAVPVASPALLADADAFWEIQVGQYLFDGEVASQVVDIGGTPTRLVVSGRGTLVYRYAERSWAEHAQFSTPSPGIGGLSVDAADVTGDGRVDFIATHTPNDQFVYVYTDDGGTWTEAMFTAAGETQVNYRAGLPGFADGTLTTQENLCSPSCDDGNYVLYSWTWDRTRRLFSADAPAAVDTCAADSQALADISLAIYEAWRFNNRKCLAYYLGDDMADDLLYAWSFADWGDGPLPPWSADCGHPEPGHWYCLITGETYFYVGGTNLPNGEPVEIGAWIALD